MRYLRVLAATAALGLAGCSAGTNAASSAGGGDAGPRPSPSAATTPTATTPAPTATTPTLRRTTPPVTTSARPSPTPTPHRIGPAPRSHGVVVLDPGHNGGNGDHPEIINRLVPAGYGQRKPCNTTGTSTNAGYPEHAFTWDVADRVRLLLAARGVTVVLTRPTDTGVGPCVDERAAIGNRVHATAVLSIHGDGSYRGHGFHVIRTSYEPAGAAVDTASARLAADLHAGMLASSGITTATYIGQGGYDRRSDLAGLNLSTRPTAMVECGNMRDAGDAAVMSSPAGRQRIAAALAAGVLRFLR